MVDICFSDSVGGLLMQIKKDICSDGVLPLDLHLNYEHIDCDIVETQAKRNIDTLKYYNKSVNDKEIQVEYKKEIKSMQNTLKLLGKILADGHDMRLWLSNTANDRCGLYWFCDFAKNYANTISIVMCPGYEYIPYLHTAHVQPDWASFNNPNFVATFAPATHILDEHEKSAYVREWTLLVKENTSLRILIDNTIVGVDDSFFDDIIMGFINSEPQPQNTVMGKMLGKWKGCVDVAFISMRIEYLIADGKIKVCEEKVDEHDCYWPRTLSLV